VQKGGTLRAGHYFLAVEGLAMLRDFLADPAGLQPRADEVASVVAAMERFPQSLAIPVVRYDVEAGYTRWAPRYDGPNPAIETEEPVFEELIGRLGRPGTALDAACGTGRHSALLTEAGWHVTGIDSTPAMLDLARQKVPGATFRPGRLDAIPLDDASVDLVVCGLALTHVEALAPVLAEFARVLRPGGHVVTTDMHPVVCATGGMAVFPSGEEGMEIHYVPNLLHEVGEYVTALVDAGLNIEACLEPKITEAFITAFPSFAVLPEATRQAFLGLPYLLIWQAIKR